MDAPQQGSLFFKLFPLEIRCRIYEEYADDYLWTAKPIDLAEDDNRARFRAGSWIRPYPPLLLECKRLAREARPTLLAYVYCSFFTTGGLHPWGLDSPFVEHTVLRAVDNFQPSLVRRICLYLYHSSESPGNPVDHLQRDFGILFPDRTKLPATVADIIFSHFEGIRFVPGEQKTLLGHYVEFLGSIHSLEKVKLRGFYHPKWLQFLEQELPGVAVEGADESEYSWDYDSSNNNGSDWDDGWDTDLALEQDHADVYFQDNGYDYDYDDNDDNDNDEGNNDDDNKDGNDHELMDWEP
ncbi:hypothetical protein DL764_008443 [Monosporascus ibericus]|uniref:F-box domain-containing protein n=1 Tax=Monosporascus ibericus TaxID=155417 RepID=A0A4Q4T098_9PEZI|nr:hypothetical protein DL764_008443 [Monosporascus ibericus]